MKSPDELRLKLSRQWENALTREARLLGGTGNWPISLPIGKPTSSAVAADLDAVKRHLDRWREVRIGAVIRESISFRATSEPVEIPVSWELRRPTEWVEACRDRTVRSEFDALAAFIEQTNPLFHSVLIRRRSLWRQRSVEEVVQACRLALELEPGCAVGKPLRAISLSGIDTKFIERNQRLLTGLLDVRFDGEVSEMGLEVFLDAATETDHWLLVADLGGDLLPFRKQRVSGSELKATALPGRRLLIVENESSLHQLPALHDTIAVLGAGFDLSWADTGRLAEKRIGYWGDIDTWGLQCLAKARSTLPGLIALMMTLDVFNAYRKSAVPEPVNAGAVPPQALNHGEQALYKFLLEEKRGRLEQEFLPMSFVHQTILDWAGDA